MDKLRVFADEQNVLFCEVYYTFELDLRLVHVMIAFESLKDLDTIYANCNQIIPTDMQNFDT